MKIEKFEDIIAWQKAQLLTMMIYKAFKECRDFNFKRQIERASVSIMNNIAEGFERKSNKEFVYFLFVAKGSSAEVRSMLNLSLNLGYTDKEESREMHQIAVEIAKMISALIKTLT